MPIFNAAVAGPTLLGNRHYASSDSEHTVLVIRVLFVLCLLLPQYRADFDET